MCFKPAVLNFGEIVETFRSGIPASLDNVIDCIATAVANNILIAMFPAEPMIISTVAVVNNVKRVSRMVNRIHFPCDCIQKTAASA